MAAMPDENDDAVRAALERREAGLQRRPRRVDGAGVVVPAARLVDTVLHVGRGLEDRHVDRARHLLGLLAGVDRPGLELHQRPRAR